ncbi:MAG: type II toxin-antitoxin system VapC family toxin [Candidatus Levybacteria bacterium]|nr:type II toxin-antitoxin system VapC family toxin [Candidatus Levybacteria bacterium]
MVIIDASVVFKWFTVDEKEQDLVPALKLLDLHLHKKEIIIVPDLLLYELANALATKTKMTLNKIKTNLQDLEDIQLKLIPVTFKLISKAITFSKTYKVSAYDAIYAVLAKEKKCNLITADVKFIKKVGLSHIKNLDTVEP